MGKGLLSCLFIVLCAFSTIAQSTEEAYFREKQKVVVFPNPAENTVHLLGLENSSRANIIITNTYGAIVLQHRWEIRNHSLSIPIPNLGAGIYVLTINSKEQQIQTKFYKR